MWPHLVEVLPVGIDRVASLRDTPPPVLVQQLVPHPAVVALHHRVLDWLARLDEVQGDAVLVRPGVEDGQKVVLRWELTPQLGVEALDKGVVGRLAGWMKSRPMPCS